MGSWSFCYGLQTIIRDGAVHLFVYWIVIDITKVSIGFTRAVIGLTRVALKSVLIELFSWFSYFFEYDC